MSSQVVFQIQSLLIVICMIYGIRKHKEHFKHIFVMSFSMIWDVVLILQIELNRSAINKATKEFTQGNDLLLKTHLFFAISTVLLYLVMVYSGRQTLRNIDQYKKRHKILGITTFSFRVLTLVTSYLT